MAYAEKRDGKLTGHWYGEVVLKSAGKFRKRFETRKEAKGYEAYVKEVGREPEGMAEKPPGMTFKDAVIQMQATNAVSRDPSGLRRTAWLVSCIGDVALSALTTAHFDALVGDLEKRPTQVRGKKTMEDSTVNRYLSAASAVLTWARPRVEKGHVPIPTIVLPWRKETGKRIHWFTETQEAAVCAFMVSEGWRTDALTIRVLCATGLRWSEFAGLEPHQCQSEWILLDETKTDTPRDVPIDPALASELRALVRSQAFPKYETIRKHLKRAVIMCGYSAKLGVHNCRHTTATRLVLKGTPLPVVKEFLGHKNITTTMKYVHVQNSQLAEASRNLYPHRGEAAQTPHEGSVLAFNKSVA